MKDVATVDSVDVLVAGGGTAGVVAAIAASRAGASTLIVESMGLLGGTQAAAWVTPMMPNKMLEESLTHGINDEILRRCAEYDPPLADTTGALLWFNPVNLALVLDEMVSEAGARVLFHTYVSDVVLDPLLQPRPEAGRGVNTSAHGDASAGNGISRITGLIVENKNGRQRIDARIIIDCTGDADVAYKAGVPCESGDQETHRNQPMSLRFAMGNIDLDAAAAHLVDEIGMTCWARPPLFEIGTGEAKNTPLGVLIRPAIEAGELEEDDLGYLQFFAINGRPRELAFNCPRIAGLSATDAWDLTRAQQIGRRRIFRISRFFRKCVRGFENSYVSVVAPMVGVRESRRIVGEYVLTEDDYLSEARFPDAVAKNAYPIDIHSTASKTGLVMKHLPPGHYHEIPYRCMVPKGVDNLLVAGRCVSATFAAQAAIRIQQNCRALGEAAGLAAAMCVSGVVSPRHLDTDELRKRLRELGAEI